MWNSRKQSERYLRKLVALGGVVQRLPNGKLVGRMVRKEGGQKRKSQWQFKVNKQTNCWEWLRSIPSSYGYCRSRGKLTTAHRVVFEFCLEPIPTGLTLDHLCRNRICVNPAHMEPVTMKENTLRGDGPTAINSRKTHCIHGHEFNKENTRIVIRNDCNGRACRECDRNENRKLRKLKNNELGK